MNDKLLSLPPIAQMMRDAGLEPKKALGQNFLFDLNLTGKIARSVPDIENSTVVEVGPGPGGLTRALLGAGARRVIAIEKDKSTEPILSKISAAANGRLEVIFGDALKIFSCYNGTPMPCAPPERGGCPRSGLGGASIVPRNLEILRVQPAGKKPMDWKSFVNGLRGAEVKLGV